MPKIRYIPQMIQTECGLCCIGMIANYYGHYVTMSELREYQQPGRDGVSLKHLCDILDWIHFDHDAYRGNLASLATMKTPFIIYYNTAHFVVVERVTSKRIYVVDPERGRVPFTYEEMEELFSGIILCAYPAKDLQKKPKGKSVWWQFLPLILKQKWIMLSILAFSALSYGATLLLPIFTERIINGTSSFSVKLIVTIFAVLLGYGLASFLNGLLSILLRTRLFKTFYMLILERMGRFEYRFFENRMKTSIMYSMSSIETVNQFYASSLIRFFVVLGAIVVQFYFVAIRSLFLLGILVALLIIYAVITRFFNRYAVRLNQTALTNKTKISEVQIEYFESIESIKVAGIGDEYLNRWKHELEAMIKKDRELDVFSTANSTISGVLVTAIPLMILLTGIWMAGKNMLSMGTAIALYSVSGLALSYAGEFISIINSMDMVGTYMDRIKDLVVQKEIVPGTKLVEDLHSVSMRGVVFKYNRHAPIVLNKINMHFGEGKKIAIVGGSGSGKSTIAKLLVGLYMPSEGHVLYNEIPETELDYKSLKGKLFMVPQDGILFNGTIRGNLNFFNHDCSEEEMIEACRAMCILEDIMAMPMKFETPMSDIGTNISGGQKQRIILARAMLSKPQFLILDEATSALDSVTEREIYKALRQLKCTQIVIAHRLSTIEDADYIYVMKDGELVEEGTHESLMALSGEYAELYLSSKKTEAE